MKIRLINLAVLLICAFPLLKAQVGQDTIRINKEYGVLYHLGELDLSLNDLFSVTSMDSLAHPEIVKARRNSMIGNVVGGLGIFFVGYTLVSYFAGVEPEWAVAYAGGGLIVCSAPFYLVTLSHAKKGVDIYNDNIKAQQKNNLSLSLLLIPEGAGLRLSW